MDRPVLTNKLTVPTSMVPLTAIKDFSAVIHHREDEDVHLQFYKQDLVNDVMEFARGNMPLIEKHFGHLDIDDRRVTNPMEFDLKFTAQLRENQQKVVDKVVQKESGIFQAPPRFGKTIVMTYLTCHFKQKTIFLSHQVDLSKQALKTFWKFTNILDIEEQEGRKLIGIVESWEDLDKYMIAFMPYQKFIRTEKAAKKLEEYGKKFGLVFVDEAHKSNAPRYSEVISAFHAKYRLGCTATVQIKSRMHVVSKFVIGPVIAKGIADQVPCQVHIVKTGVMIPFRCTNIKQFFQDMLYFLANHKERNDFIAKWIALYAKAGHSCIAVSERTAMLDDITKKLKKMGIAAEAFHRNAVPTKFKRENLLEQARKNEVKVLLANRNMVLGLDIPRLTAFFNLTPSANQPNYYQELSRVRTPFEGKNVAHIIDFVDYHPVVEGCLKSRKKVYEREKCEVFE